jgi:hypothetical protein
MVAEMNSVMSLPISEPWLETVLTLDLALSLSHHRPAIGFGSCETDQTSGAVSGPALDGMGPTCLLPQVEADMYAASAELQGVTRRLILSLTED